MIDVVGRINNLNIVVVDDDEMSANLLVMILKKYGCKATAFYDAFTAIESLKAKMPDIVFLDIDMAEINGFEAAKKIRVIQSKKTPVLVGLSGAGRADDFEMALSAGFDHYLLKPLDFDLLHNIIRQ